MGNPFLTLLLLGLLFDLISVPTAAHSQERIDLDLEPVQVVPPSGDLDVRERLSERRAKRLDREEKDKAREEPIAKRNRLLAAESQKTRPYAVLAQVSLVVPTVMISGPRKDYTAELTSHFSLFFRITPKQESADARLWWVGARVAPFAGSGTYENTTGRYGFTYFGPMIAVGKIGPPTDPNDPRNASNEAAGKKAAGGRVFDPGALLERDTWMLSAGISLQSRGALTEASNDPVNRDLNTLVGVQMDGTGLWAEYSSGTIHFGAVATNYVMGVQLGDGKVFIWAGVAAGAWY